METEDVDREDEILGEFVGVRWIDGEITLDLANSSGPPTIVSTLTFCPNLEGFLEVLGIYSAHAPRSARMIKRRCINGRFADCPLFPDGCERKQCLDRKFQTAFDEKCVKEVPR